MVGSPEEVDAELTRLSVEMARLLLERARASEPAEEFEARESLTRLLESPETQLFSTALTDRIHRTRSAACAVNVLSDLIERTGGGRNFPAVDRMQLRAARMFGPMMPKLTMNAVLTRLREEALPYLWDAEPESLRRHLARHHRRSLSVNLNYLGEEVLGNEEAAARLQTYCDFAVRGDIEAISVKLSGIDPHLELLAIEDTVSRLFANVSRVLEAGQSRPGGPPLVYFDMEAYHDLPVTEALLTRLLDEAPEDARLGLAIQAYLPESLGLISRLSSKSGQRVARGGAPLRIRLVKGANLQMERVSSSLHRLPLPIFPTKAAVDAHFKRSLRLSVASATLGHVIVGLGSHNLFDVSYGLLLRERAELGSRLQIEMLEGMAGSLGNVVAEVGGGLLLYCPAVLAENFSSAVSYLVRRLDENTAPDNFLRDAPRLKPGDASFETQASRFIASARASWHPAPDTFRTQNRRAESKTGIAARFLDEPFDNASDTDFTQHVNRAFVEKRLAALHDADSIRVRPLVAGASDEQERLVIDGFDPSRPGFSYPITLASPADIELALTQATEQLPYWLAREPKERAELLLKVAETLEKHRGRLIAAMVLDGGKRISEADIEISEAVDFANYYARQALELEEILDPRGVTVVTPPWNFPLAIPLGGVLGALVAGNTVILKPAPETPYVAYLAAKICYEAGVPREVLSYLPCRDEDASPLIVDPRVRAVVLTGATETAKLFKKMRPDLCLMAETGGKNAAYVGPVSDREQAISDIVRSAFGHAGQKCSALSVLVLHREVYEDEQFKRQLIDATKSLPVGPAWDANSIVTPLIHPPAGHLRTIVKRGDEYGSWLLKPHQDERNPRLLSPGILWGVEPKSFPHMTEFFGPVLSVLVADTLQEAVEVMNSTPYGLTAGLFSLEEKDHEAFVNSIEAGNVYINRPITGAVVGRQAFGGHKHSCFGPGAKAGGPDYVRQMTVCHASTLSEQALLEKRAEDYDRAFYEHFSQVHPGTAVVGEENYLRYLPGPTAVVLGAEAEAVDIRFAMQARDLCRAHHPIFILAGPTANRTAQLLGQVRAESFIESGEDLVARAVKLKLERLRVIGKANEELLMAAAKNKVTVITDAVSDVGRQELALFLKSQSISFSVHRHGNLTLAALSHLEEALDIWK